MFRNIQFISFRDLNYLFPSGPLALQEINSLRSLLEINVYIPSRKLMILAVYSFTECLVRARPRKSLGQIKVYRIRHMTTQAKRKLSKFITSLPNRKVIGEHYRYFSNSHSYSRKWRTSLAS